LILQGKLVNQKRNFSIKSRAKQSTDAEKMESIYQTTANYVCTNDPDGPELSGRKLAKRVKEELEARQREGKLNIKKINGIETIRRIVKNPFK
jgi:hypothetical protein